MCKPHLERLKCDLSFQVTIQDYDQDSLIIRVKKKFSS